LGNFEKSNQTNVKVELKNTGFTIALNSFGILVGIVLVINSIIAFVGGIILFLYDRKAEHNSIVKK